MSLEYIAGKTNDVYLVKFYDINVGSGGLVSVRNASKNFQKCKLESLTFREDVNDIEEIRIENLYRYLFPYIKGDKLENTMGVQIFDGNISTPSITFVLYDVLDEELVNALGVVHQRGDDWDFFALDRFLKIFKCETNKHRKLVNKFQKLTKNVYCFTCRDKYYSFRVVDSVAFDSLRIKYKLSNYDEET